MTEHSKDGTVAETGRCERAGTYPGPGDRVTVVCDLPQIRGGDTGFPMQVVRDDETAKLYIRAVNEGGFACIDLDLYDIATWLGVGDEAITTAISTCEHSKRHVADI